MNAGPADDVPPAAACPICGQVEGTRGAYRPFCSDRCKWIDLGRWFTGAYRIPAGSPLDEDEGGSDGERA